MPAENTYEAIATQTLGSAAASVTFSSIPGTYTDLVLISNARSTIASTGNNLYARVNSDSGTNYSATEIAGDGSSAYSDRQTNATYAYIGFTSGASSASDVYGISISHFQNYSNTTTNKTILSRGDQAGNSTHAIVSMWRSTSAITQIVVYPAGANNLAAGSSFSLYGIKAA
jgi:hypothetical protein